MSAYNKIKPFDSATTLQVPIQMPTFAEMGLAPETCPFGGQSLDSRIPIIGAAVSVSLKNDIDLPAAVGHSKAMICHVAYGNATTGLTASEGDYCYVTGTDKFYIYRSGAWVEFGQDVDEANTIAILTSGEGTISLPATDWETGKYYYSIDATVSYTEGQSTTKKLGKGNVKVGFNTLAASDLPVIKTPTI